MSEANAEIALSSKARPTETSTRLGYYRHYKGGIYKATGHGILENTRQVCVIYEQVKTGAVYIRTLASWCERVEIFDALDRVTELVPRFSYLGTEPPAELPLESVAPAPA